MNTVAEEKEDSNASSLTLLVSDEISLWMSDEMLRTENKSIDSSTSTSKMISPFSENSSSESEKIVPKQLRFADEQTDDFISSVVEQLKEQVKFDISSGNIKIKRKGKGSSRSKRPKSIEELLDIIDNEIPIALKGPFQAHQKIHNEKPSSTTNKKEIRPRKAVENLEIVEDKLDDGFVSQMSEIIEPEEEDLRKDEGDIINFYFRSSIKKNTL